ncbi:hypothetical protein ASC92_05640 [Variovorax sp. Root411]|nr:hypothetical protein ASC92_05640 [Variovorax sp. Root411]
MTASSINPIDRLLATGYGAVLVNPRGRFPRILGRDGVGTVMATGSAVSHLRVGQRVMLAVSPRRDGTYAEQVTIPGACACALGETMTDDAAAVVGYAGSTAVQALRAADLDPVRARGRRLLIHGASGGLGTIAVQMAAGWGAQVTAVCSTRNHAWLKELGASRTMDYEEARGLQTLPADSVIDFATPASEGGDRRHDPLLAALQRTDGRRVYATVITPTLGLVTRHGLLPGLLRAGADLAWRKASASLNGVRYRQVLFREESEALARLVDFFSKAQAQSVVQRVLAAPALPTEFSESTAPRIPGKTLVHLFPR